MRPPRLGRILVLAIVALTATTSLADPVVEVARFAISPTRPITSVHVSNNFGDVRVEGHAGAEVLITAEKRADSDERLAQLVVAVVPVRDGSVRVQTEFRGAPASLTSMLQINLRVQVPRSAFVNAATARGTLGVSDLDQGVELAAAAGQVNMRNVQGNVDAHIQHAAVSMQHMFGAVDAAVQVGDVDAEAIAGDRFVLSVGRGRVAMRRVSSRFVEVMTTHGDILVDGQMSAVAVWRIGSVMGGVDAAIAAPGGIIVARGQRLDMPGVTGSSYAGRFGAEAGNVALQLTSRNGLVRYRPVAVTP